MTRGGSQRGSATVLAAVLLTALAVVTALGSVVAGAVVDQRRVESAADLGALAGAAALQRGAPGCAAVATVVRRNGARLSRCAPAGLEVEVTAGLSPRSFLGVRWQATSTARAGPVDLLTGR